MENGPLILGLEDGTIDVERLLVEPQDGHVSMDSVLCFNDKIPENAMDMEEITHSFDCSNAGIAQAGKDILNGEVLDAMPGEVGYLQLENDFCSMREEYLLGVEFAESITNLDYGSSDGLQTSVSDGPNLACRAGTSAPWESDILRIMEAPDCLNNELNMDRSKLSNFPSHHCSVTSAEEKPLKSHTLCAFQNVGKFQDISSYSFQDILPDEDYRLPAGSAEMHGSIKVEKNDEFDMAARDNENDRFQGQDASATTSTQQNCVDALPQQKRSRKPTQRYIDELADNLSRYPKKRREASSPSLRKCLGAKDDKKCHMASKATRLPAEESSVIAIQVPFASVVQKESPKSHACDTVGSSDRGNLMTRSKEKRVVPENLKKTNESVTAIHLRKRDDFVTVTSQKKRDACMTESPLKKRDNLLTAASPKNRVACVTETHLKTRDDHIAAASPKKRDCVITVSPKKRNHRVTAMSQKKRDECLIEARENKKDECVSAESSEEVSGRRKHHRLWSIAEVKKLIDGVAQYGVGRWSRIKKIFFSASPHRTSVDLKDKWRNLLKASGMQELGNHQGEKKRNPAWRPLPKSILRRVCELAAMYPYPKGQKPKLAHHSHDSPDRGTDITLSDYRRILRSINGD